MDKEGWVELALLKNFRRVRDITQDDAFIIEVSRVLYKTDVGYNSHQYTEWNQVIETTNFTLSSSLLNVCDPIESSSSSFIFRYLFIYLFICMH